MWGNRRYLSLLSLSRAGFPLFLPVAFIKNINKGIQANTHIIIGKAQISFPDGKGGMSNSSNNYSFKSFTEYLNESTHEITICGAPNMRVPMYGHTRLFEATTKVAGKGGTYRIYPLISESNASPLSFNQSVKYARKMFPRYARSIVLDESIRSVHDALSVAYSEGFSRANVVVPEDQRLETEVLVSKNNGISGRHGFYHFREGVNVISSGTDTPAPDRLIESVEVNDYRSFIKGLPEDFSESKSLFNDIRKGMGLTETHDFRTHIQLSPVSVEREEYISGNLFYEGDEVIVKESGEVGKVAMLGTNYLLVEMANGQKMRKWLDSVEKIQESEISVLSPQLDRLLDRFFHKNKYKKGVKYYIQRHGSKGTRQDLVKIAKMTQLDFRNLEKVLHELINNGILPKSLATRKDLLESNINIDTTIADQVEAMILAEETAVERVKREKEQAMDDLEDEYDDKLEDARRRDEIDAEQEKRQKEEDQEREQEREAERSATNEDAVPDVEGDQPAKYYKGVKTKKKDDRARHFDRGAKKDDDDPSAYKPAPGDKGAKTKPSKYTKKYDQMYGEESMKSFSEFSVKILESNVDKSLENKADESGAPKSVLKDVYDRGVAAWKTGHRPGTTPSQWGLARVNSFLTYGKTAKTTDKDLFEKLPDGVQSKIKNA